MNEKEVKRLTHPGWTTMRMHATLWWRSQSSIVRMWVACVRTRGAPVIRPPKREREKKGRRRPMTVYAHTRAAQHILGPSFTKKIKIKGTYRPKNCALARGSSFLPSFFSLCRPRLDIVQRFSVSSFAGLGHKEKEGRLFVIISCHPGLAIGHRFAATICWSWARKCKYEEKGTSSRCDHTR